MSNDLPPKSFGPSETVTLTEQSLISWFDPIQQRVYTADRIGLDVVVTDAKNNFAVNTIGGLNQVATAGNNASPCWGAAATEVQAIPSIITGLGSQNSTRPGNGLTRFGCRNAPFFANFGNAFPGFGPNGFFGGLPGAQCCASRGEWRQPTLGPQRASQACHCWLGPAAFYHPCTLKDGLGATQEQPAHELENLRRPTEPLASHPLLFSDKR